MYKEHVKLKELLKLIKFIENIYILSLFVSSIH